MNTNLETSSTSRQPPLRADWIERLFERMSGLYGARFADAWRGVDPERVKRTWAEELAGFSGDEIARGVTALKTRDWPPTLPEFAKLCRPPSDPRADWAEACEQMRIRLQGRGEDRWSRPQVYWAAVAIGWYDLNSTAWDQIKTRWTNALENAKTDPIPEYLAQLPPPGQQSITREEAANRINEIRTQLGTGVPLPGTTPAGTKWAVRLMEREAGGEALHSISSSAWREVLGYAADVNAKDALKAYREHEQTKGRQAARRDLEPASK